MALLALILYTPKSSATATSQPHDLRDSPCVVVNRSKVMPRHCQVSRACSGSSGTTAAGRFQPNRIFCSRTQGLFWIQRYHRGRPVPAQSHLLFPHPSAHRRLGSSTSPAARKARTIPPVEISSTPRSETPLARSTRYASLDRSFARIVCARIYIYIYIYIYDRACVRTHIHVYAHALVSA